MSSAVRHVRCRGACCSIESMMEGSSARHGERETWSSGERHEALRETLRARRLMGELVSGWSKPAGGRRLGGSSSMRVKGE